MDTPIPLSNPQPLPSDVPAFKRRIRKIAQLPEDAPDQVGEGVEQVLPSDVPKGRKRKRSTVTEEVVPNVVSLDPQAEWVDAPTMVDQIKDESAWKTDRQEVKVYNLSDDKQLAEYNALLTRCASPSTNCFVISEQSKFAPTLGTWSSLVKLQYVKYRKMLKIKKS